MGPQESSTDVLTGSPCRPDDGVQLLQRVLRGAGVNELT